MAVTLIEFNHTNTRNDLPQIKQGQVVRVHQKISETKKVGKKTETKERIQIFEGLVIGVKGKTGINTAITVRKISNGIGVEKIFPVNSPVIEKIEIVKITKARRAKLNYMRDRIGKATKPKGELATAEDNKPMENSGINKIIEDKENAKKEEAVKEEKKETADSVEEKEVEKEDTKKEEKVEKAEEKKEEVK